MVPGVPGRLIGDPPGIDNCLRTEGGVEQGFNGTFLWQGNTGVERPMLRGNVWLLFIEPDPRFPGTPNFLPDTKP